MKLFSQQTGYEFVYYKDVLKNTRPVSLSLENVDIAEALNFCLNNQKLTYSIEDKIIVIKTGSLFVRSRVPEITPQLDAPPVIGIVRGPDGKPLAGVNVIIKGTKKGVVTDVNGRFSIDAEQGKTLVVSNVGYASKEIKVKERIR